MADSELMARKRSLIQCLLIAAGVFAAGGYLTFQFYKWRMQIRQEEALVREFSKLPLTTERAEQAYQLAMATFRKDHSPIFLDALALNPYCPPDILVRLIGLQRSVDYFASRNPNLPFEGYILLQKSNWSTSRDSIAKRIQRERWQNKGRIPAGRAR